MGDFKWGLGERAGGQSGREDFALCCRHSHGRIGEEPGAMSPFGWIRRFVYAHWCHLARPRALRLSRFKNHRRWRSSGHERFDLHADEEECGVGRLEQAELSSSRVESRAGAPEQLVETPLDEPA